ncbi:MAG: DUF2520 domain-containing protein [Acidimicrobiales bacterium]
MEIAIVGAGRAGQSFARALSAHGHRVRLVHHDQLGAVGRARLVLLATPDDAVAETAARLAPDARRVVAHIAGSLTLAPLAPHPRVASLHPLAVLSSPRLGAHRLVGATYAVAGDDLVLQIVSSLQGRAIRVPDERRALYHATAAVAANHLVALMGHVERLARHSGLELTDFLALSRQALDDVAARGPRAALTGPASRGDMATIDAHLAALAPEERDTYVALTREALALRDHDVSLLA